MSIGERITDLRKEKKLSQGQLADALEVTRQAVSKWENDLTTPDSLKLIKLAELLETDIEYLTTGRIAVPSRPPVVIRSGETIEKIVEKPVIQVVEKTVEKEVRVPVERIIEVPVVEYVDRPVVKRIVRTRYVRNPMEFLLIGGVCFMAGLIIGFLI